MDLDRNGFCFEPEAVPIRMVNEIARQLPPARAPAHSLRGLLRLEFVREFAEWLVAKRLTGTTQADMRPVRGILFDKPAGANWSVPWHQDRVVAVRERKESPGFSRWTLKSGVDHVDAPKSILEGMVTLRIHLDDVTESDGPLRALPGTHRGGALAPAAIKEAAQSIKPEIICGKAGSILRMRPLLVHSSRSSALPVRRRILHLEFASIELPHGLEWARF